jgi:guanine deaminase
MKLALRGDLLDFTATPLWGSTSLQGVRWRPDHWLLIDGRRIVGALAGEQHAAAS